MLQAGPVVSMIMPRDRISGQHQGFAFVEFETPEDADYAIRIMNNVKLYGKLIKVNKAMKEDKATRDAQDWMVKLFVGNLAPEVDEKILSDVFSNFGALLSCTITSDPETGKSKGFGFITFDTFEAGDAAIAALNEQFLCNKQIVVNYAFKKDSNNERHGTEAERLLAAKARQKHITVPLMPITELPHIGTNAPSSSGVSGLAPTASSILVPPPPPQAYMGAPPPPMPPTMFGMAIPPPPHAVMGIMPPPPPFQVGGPALPPPSPFPMQYPMTPQYGMYQQQFYSQYPGQMPPGL